MRVVSRELARFLTGYGMTVAELDDLAIDHALVLYMGLQELERERARDRTLLSWSVWAEKEHKKRLLKSLE